jgi:hypothetical protein
VKKSIVSLLLAATVIVSPCALARGGPSEASASSILVTGSVVLVMSTLPLIAMESVFEGSVGRVQPAGNKTTDIQIRQHTSGNVTVIRVPDQALLVTPVRAGQKAELIADQNGHTLKVEGRPVVYVPGSNNDALLHSKEAK